MFYTVLIIANIVIVILFEGCKPVREFMTWKDYKGSNKFPYLKPINDVAKKNIFIVADNLGTEIFDLLAPYYLFNATGKANVYVVAQNKYPVVLRKGLFLLPNFTYEEVDSLKMNTDVIVIPNLSGMTAKEQNPIIINWIKKHKQSETKMLSVCDGSLTAASTGLYDGKPITTHSSDFDDIKKQLPKANWVKDISVTKSENIYSTAGVSNAVEGSLQVINDLFGKEIMNKVRLEIKYPFENVRLQHNSAAITFGDKIIIANKVFFKKNPKIGVLIIEGINEFELATILDTYNRTFPKSIESYSLQNAAIKTKYGLTLIPTGDIESDAIDELHILEKEVSNIKLKNNTTKISHSNYEGYIINHCIKNIEQQYGIRFSIVVKKLLDYN